MDNKTLLSQQEIDTLISFLQENRNVPIGTVLDQDSIDKLIETIKYNNANGIYFDKEFSSSIIAKDKSAFINDSNGIALDIAGCSLVTETAENGFVRLYCLDNGTGLKYRISPACLSEGKYLEDDSEWGLAVSGHTLNEVAKLFSIPVAKEVIETANRNFAKLIFADENAALPAYYAE